MTRISSSDLHHLGANGFVVVENFLPPELQSKLVNDAKKLRSNSKFEVARIGHDGMVQDENTPYRDIRHSETCFIGRLKEPEPLAPARHELYSILDQLRCDLGGDILRKGVQTNGLAPLDSDVEELMYAYYPEGGYYRRHRDAEPGSSSNWRKYSLLLYLNQSWKPQHGGHLRLHRDSGGDHLPPGELPNFLDVDPRGGTLVLFRSDLVPHEVLDTRAERLAIVGWYLSSPTHFANTVSSVARVLPTDLHQLADNGFAVVKNFLPAELQADLVSDVKELRSQSKFEVAKIGHDGMVQDENTPFRDIRYSETCPINRLNEPEPPSSARRQLYDILDQLRLDLGGDALKDGIQTKGLAPLDSDLEEVMYAYYPKGGYYRRHRDAEPASSSNWRKYSFLLYLNQDWKPQDGGHLRLHRDSGGDHLPPGELPNFLDVDPRGGTLVLFRSDLVSHEVLDTNAERLAIVGWYLSSRNSMPETPNKGVTVAVSTQAIHPNSLAALRTLREACPRLAQKLKPSPPVNNSGLLGDDFFFPTAPVEETKPSYEDTDPRYWESIAALNTQGHINTLSLSGQRLGTADSHCLSAALFRNVATLDLGNTDLSVTTLVECLRQSPQLRQLHLGGNAIGDNGITQMLEGADILGLRAFDLRYNDIGPNGAAALSTFLTKDACGWEMLYLEGNRLGDTGAEALATTGNLRELFLGQNGIGPDGASALAKGLVNGRLKKLYLEGNQIGPQGAMAFRLVLEGMGENKALEKLYVDNNGIGKEDSIKLGQSLNSATVIGDVNFG